MAVNKRLILVEIYIDENVEENDLHLTEQEIFEDALMDFQLTADAINSSIYFAKAATKVWIVPDTGDCSEIG